MKLHLLPTVLSVTLLWALSILPITRPIRHHFANWVSNPGESPTQHGHPLYFAVPPLDRVAMKIIHQSRYFVLGSKAWDYMLPSGGHVVHTMSDPVRLEDLSHKPSIQTHTVALFHQLRCLQLIHDAYMDDEIQTSSAPFVSHCMNYIRQTLLCMCDIRNGSPGTEHTRSGYDYMCYDWEGVYKEAERNRQSYLDYMMSQPSVS